MKSKGKLISVGIVASLAVVFGVAISAANQDKYTLKVPGGLAFSEFRGYENWEVISASQRGETMAVIVGNPEIIGAFKSGIPANGKPFPEGSKIAKIEWRPKKLTDPPFSAKTPDTVPGDLTQVEFIEKDSKRFSDSHGWGYGMFDYDVSAGTFKPATLASKPPVGHDAKCGAACHTLAASKDYIFTTYPRR